MAGTLKQVGYTPGTGALIEVLQDSAGNDHPVGVLEFVDALLNPILASAANPLPVSVGNFPATQPVSGAFYQATQPISAAALPLPAGAATAANQPSLGTAGAAAANVLTVQGIAAMTPLLVNGSSVTQPISGTVTVSNAAFTANAGTNLNTSLLALETGGNLAGINTKLAGTLTVGGTVGVTSLPALPAGTNTIGTVNAVPSGDVIEIAGATTTVLRAFANATASGETNVVAGTAGKQIRVLAYKIGPVSAAVNVYFDNATSGAISSTCYLAANGGMGRSTSLFGHFQTGTQGEALRINLSAAANVGVDVTYILF